MARPQQGWTLAEPPAGEKYKRVRFTDANGRPRKLSTGESDPTRAAIAAARIYAEEYNRPPEARERRKPGRPRAAGVATDLRTAAQEWLASLEGVIAAPTLEAYALAVDTHLADYFLTAENITTESAREYAKARLKSVKGKTAGKELSVLRQFSVWFFGDEHAPIIPGVPKRAQGTAHKQGKRTRTELSPDEVCAVLDRLPEWSGKSGKRWPMRARFIVAYETGLRPATLDRLSVPEHYTRGRAELRIPPELDKARDGRPLPISDKAREALDGVLPPRGLIFGRHDYRDALEKAAGVLSPEKRRTFHAYDLRAAFGTHFADDPRMALTGLQYAMGHKSIATTALYVKANKRALDKALREMGRTGGKTARAAELQALITRLQAELEGFRGD